jgi:protein-L-isoaspartate(D-aspartate) O-methyltransferase
MEYCSESTCDQNPVASCVCNFDLRFCIAHSEAHDSSPGSHKVVFIPSIPKNFREKIASSLKKIESVENSIILRAKKMIKEIQSQVNSIISLIKPKKDEIMYLHNIGDFSSEAYNNFEYLSSMEICELDAIFFKNFIKNCFKISLNKIPFYCSDFDFIANVKNTSNLLTQISNLNSELDSSKKLITDLLINNEFLAEDYHKSIRQSQSLSAKSATFNRKEENTVNYKDNNPKQVKLIKKVMESGNVITEKVKNVLESTDRGWFTINELYEDPDPQHKNSRVLLPVRLHMVILSYIEKYLFPGMSILDVGSSSGYLTVCFAKIIGRGKVFGLESNQKLANRSIRVISKIYPELLNSREMHIKIIRDDWKNGIPEFGPFNFINIGAAVNEIPNSLIEQLAPGGIIFAPVVNFSGIQKIQVLWKDAYGTVNTSELQEPPEVSYPLIDA